MSHIYSIDTNRMESEGDRITYSPTTKAVIDAADEFIGAIEDAWADLDDSFEINDEPQDQSSEQFKSIHHVDDPSLSKMIDIPNDIQISNIKDVVSPIETDVRHVRRSASDHMDIVQRELPIVVDHEQQSEHHTELSVSLEQEENHTTSLNEECTSQFSVLVEKSMNKPLNKNHRDDKVNLCLHLRIEALEEQLTLAMKEKDRLEENLNESTNQNTLLEEICRATKAQHDKMEKKYRNEIQSLEKTYRKQVQSAEDDANVALEIAKDSDEKRHRMELALESVIRELERHSQIPATPISAKIESNLNQPNTLMDVENDSCVSSSAFSLDTLETRVTSDAVTPSRKESPIMTTVAPSLGSQRSVSAILLTVRDIIRTSGMQLNLPGKWFSDKSPPSIETIETDIESMSKSYCMLVENIIKQQKDDFKDLKDFCNYLEGKLIHQ